MPKFSLSRFAKNYLLVFSLFGLILIGIIAIDHWLLAVVFLILLILLINYLYQTQVRFQKELQKYISTISHRVKRAGSDVLQTIPVGTVLYDEAGNIEWFNPYFQILVGNQELIGKPLAEIFPSLEWDSAARKQTIPYQDKTYQIEMNKEERLLYITDITEYRQLQEKYQNTRPVFGIIHLDNLDEVAQGLDELSRSILLTEVVSLINDWATELDIYLRRYAADKFWIVMTEHVLKKLETTRFDILDRIREMTSDNKIPLTLSIGIGAGVESLIELGQITQSSLDIALGRGGDQAAVKAGDRLSFYGGKTNAVEKRNRVRARVISQSLKDLIRESDTVLIMGHKTPDMDAIGASIGVLKAVHIHGKTGYIVLDDANPSILTLLDEIHRHEKLPQYFITPERALNMVTAKTLLVMVDTHKPSLTIEPKIVAACRRIVVIDHHRRGEEIVKDPVLMYIEPYASSTSELVTELLQYQSDQIEMDRLEATALLAGIVVDTKSFAFRTGARTFEAASFLRRNSADPALVQKLLKEDIEHFIQRAELVKKARIAFDHIAIAVAKEKLGQLLIAQTADTLLNMSGIFASFVISVRPDGLVGISARSLGQINVQTIMERLGGGGHLTNAAVQLEGIDVEEAESRLMEVLTEVQKEGGLSV
ncbi:DHH family phosphoesterase [Tepidibacillus fermentans]|uniref:Cyclic-di-AMP phosphodiesterase n=1 Tax=Tepidibacillus fermentans TaxID=1281767 RepID=A0A4R3KCT0_9BACI|nr:DHH family phosphoesterase [Tepidibacillus fermentans]TCS80793.1 c-di-AMP phosphodiesterase-like protein [Tepidibacillus fermentans]